MNRFQETIRYLALPLLLLGLTIAFITSWNVLGLPPPEDFIKRADEMYATYGYQIVFLGALVEGLIVIGWYLPGSVITVLGVVFNQNNPVGAVLVVTIACVSFIITAVINYAMGRYGWYLLLLRFGLGPPLEKMRQKLVEHGPPLILITYFHPNLGSLTATCCGILRIPFRQFLQFTIISVIMWNTLWGVIAYFTGTLLLRLLNMWVFAAVIALWVLFRVVKILLRQRHESIRSK